MIVFLCRCRSLGVWGSSVAESRLLCNVVPILVANGWWGGAAAGPRSGTTRQAPRRLALAPRWRAAPSSPLALASSSAGAPSSR